MPEREYGSNQGKLWETVHQDTTRLEFTPAGGWIWVCDLKMTIHRFPFFVA
jgi:hypothetical protein